MNTADVTRYSVGMLAWAGIVLGVAYLTFGGGGAFIGIYLVQWRVASLALIAVAMLAWLLATWRDRSWRPRTVLWPAFAAALAAFVISTLTSWSPRLSLEYLAYAVLCTALYLLLVRLLAHQAFRARMGALAVLLCVALGLEYVVVVLARWLSWWAALGHLAAPPLRPGFEGLVYGNPSAVATMMLLLCPAALAHMGASTRARQVVMGLLLALTAAVVLLTESRGAWLGVGVGLATVLAVLTLLPSSRVTGSRMLSRRAQRGAIVGVFVVGLPVALLLGRAIVARALDSSGDRLTLFLAAIRMFESSPVVGSGPGTWVARRIAFTSGTTGSDVYIPHAHDIYLQTLAEFGVVGAIAGAVVLVALGWLVLGALRDPDATRRRYGWGALFALAYLAGHQLVDFYPNFPAVMFALALTVGFLDATSGTSPVDRRLSRMLVTRRPAAGRAMAAALPLAIIAALGFSSWSESVAVTQAAAVDAANAGHRAVALADARDAATADPNMPPYQFTLGITAAATGDLSLAQTAFTRAAAASDFPEAWLDLAAVQYHLGEQAAAAASLHQAMRLGRQQALVSVAAAALYARLGDQSDAAAALANAIVLIPELPADPYWAASPVLRAIAARAAAAAASGAGPALGFRILLAAGKTAEAEQLASGLGTQSHAALLYIAAWTGSASARAELEADAMSGPFDPTTVGLAELAAARAGDQTATDRLDNLLLQGGNRSGHARPLIDIVASCGTCEPVPGAAAESWGEFTYRRPIPADLLVLDLPRLGFR